MKFSRQRDALKDVVAIPVTPYRDDRIDVETFQSLLRRLVDHSVRVITPNGNTSEFYALSPEERRLLIRSSYEAVGTETELVVGIGLDVKTAVEEATYAQDQGIGMAMIHQPVHPHVSREGWLDYHAQIAGSLPEMGFVLYVKNTYTDGELLRRLADRCPNVIGVKFSLTNPVTFASARRIAGPDRFAWLAGLAEESAISYASHGADGFTSGLVNVYPQLTLKLRDALRARDFAATEPLLDLIAPFERMRAVDNSADNVSVVKEALCQLGLCDRTIRPPSHTLKDEQRREVKRMLQQWSKAREAVLA